jgi:hypothetical protein
MLQPLTGWYNVVKLNTLTLRITGKIKVHSKAAQLHFVQVNAIVRAFFVDTLENATKMGTFCRFR